MPLLCLFHGLRNGEAAGLRVEDIDEEDGFAGRRAAGVDGTCLGASHGKRLQPGLRERPVTTAEGGGDCQGAVSRLRPYSLGCPEHLGRLLGGGGQSMPLLTIATAGALLLVADRSSEDSLLP